MLKHEFIINNRFLIEPSVNILKDLEAGTETRLEPRLMNLLCLLSENKGKVVNREYLIKEIWSDYGGADEGLSQAISFLRKALVDDRKKIIETIPKKGYILYATISHGGNTISEIVQPKVQANSKRLYKIATAAILALVVVGYFLFNQSSKSIAPESSGENMETKFPEFKEGDEENFKNTITTVDSVGTKYKLVQIGDRRPKFYVNEKLIEIEAQEKYLPLIDKLRKELRKRQKETSDQ